MLLAELAIAVLLLVSGVLAFRRSMRKRLHSRTMFWTLVGLGIIVGGYLSVGLIWQTKTMRFFGAPVTAAVFQLSENGYWEDYVGPLTVPAAVINFAVGFLLPHLPSWIRAHLRTGEPGAT